MHNWIMLPRRLQPALWATFTIHDQSWLPSLTGACTVIEKFSMETCRVSKSDQRLLVIVSCLVGGSLTFLAFYLRILAKLRGGRWWTTWWSAFFAGLKEILPRGKDVLWESVLQHIAGVLSNSLESVKDIIRTTGVKTIYLKHFIKWLGKGARCYKRGCGKRKII